MSENPKSAANDVEDVISTDRKKIYLSGEIESEQSKRLELDEEKDNIFDNGIFAPFNFLDNEEEPDFKIQYNLGKESFY